MNKQFIQRNILIFIKDKVGIFFSFLGMVISLVIYIFFLRSNLVDSLTGINHSEQFIDTWMISGLISIVSMTSTLIAFGQKLEDKKNNRLDDFIVNSQIKSNTINQLYTLTSVMEGIVSTFIFSLICYAYLSLTYHYNAYNVTFL